MDVCRHYEALIGAQVDGTATAEEQARLDAHLRECHGCAQATAELQRTRQLVTALPSPKPPQRLMPAISARLRAQRVSPWERFWWQWSSQAWLKQAAVAMVLVLCIALTGTMMYRGGPLTPAGTHAPQVAQVHPSPAPGPVADTSSDFASYAVASHETFERDRAFGDTSGVQDCAYAP